jgi:hypothetical protein
MRYYNSIAKIYLSENASYSFRQILFEMRQWSPIVRISFFSKYLQNHCFLLYENLFRLHLNHFRLS